MTPAELADVTAALVVVDLAPGVDPQAFVDDLGERIAGWDGGGAFLRVYAEPLRPAAIIDVAAMRGVPALLAGVFGLAMIGHGRRRADLGHPGSAQRVRGPAGPRAPPGGNVASRSGSMP